MDQMIRFAYHWVTTRNPPEAARLAGYDPSQWPSLVSNRVVRREARKLQRAFQKESAGQLAKRGLEQLIFGSSAGNNPVSQEMGADLFRVSEWKQPKGGGTEVKYWDKLKALELLIRLEEQEGAKSGGRESAVYQALEQGAEALQLWGEEQDGEGQEYAGKKE